MRRLLTFSLVASVVSVTPAPGPPQPPVKVVVFEGRGLGHGVGLPRDGANAMARRGASPEDILARFYPGTDLRRDARFAGEVRVEVAETPKRNEGLVVSLPDGGRVQDGRTAPVAPSFPLEIGPGGRVQLGFDGAFYRADQLAPGSEPQPGRPTTSSAPPPLAASPHPLWVLPRDRRGTVAVARGDHEYRFRGVLEAVAEADTLRLVDVVSVEDWLLGLDLSDVDGAEPSAAVLRATVIADRTYALRAAAAMPSAVVQLFADERSQRYVGTEAETPATRLAVRDTAGEVVTYGGQLAAALTTMSAGGQTAAADEVFGSAGGTEAYLRPVSYRTDDPIRWRVEMNLADVASKLGYPGTPDGIEVTRRSASQRPAVITLTGPGGPLEVRSPVFDAALGLPSTSFDLRVETRDAPLAPRQGSPPFQQMPGPPEAKAPPAAPGAGGSGARNRIPFLVAMVGVVTLGGSLMVLLAANAQRVMRLRRERRRSRREHPSRQLFRQIGDDTLLPRNMDRGATWAPRSRDPDLRDPRRADPGTDGD